MTKMEKDGDNDQGEKTEGNSDDDNGDEYNLFSGDQVNQVNLLQERRRPAAGLIQSMWRLRVANNM